MNVTTPSLYESDFYGWVQAQAHTLRTRNVDELDFDNLLEEIEAMGRGEKRSLKSRLALILVHLLKWQYQPHYRSKSWRLTIQNQREEVWEILEDSPSLKAMLDVSMDRAWKKARREAELETGLDASIFPAQCPWQFEQVMDNGFWPQ